ncbi:MAG: LamG-like jellyroll fold domain-containing protein [Verrucomicrobiota bacterium]
MITRFRFVWWLRVVVASFLVASIADAAIISYWRFEQDDDPSANGLENPNEIAGEPAFISSSAKIDATANPGSLPNDIVPGTGLANTASLDGSPLDINGSAAYSSTLNVSSMTVELWARTEESTAVVIARSTTSGNNIDNSIADGFRMYDTQDLKVQYYVDTGGGSQLVTIDTNFRMDTDNSVNGSAEWHHLAFTYDEATGLGQVWANGSVIGSNDGADNQAIYWGDISGGDQPQFYAGWQMDGFDFSKTATDNGYIDEIRFSDAALGEDDFLNAPVPEPGTYAVGALLMVGAWICHRRRRLAVAEESE